MKPGAQPAIVTRRRVLVGAAAVATLIIAVLLLGPDLRSPAGMLLGDGSVDRDIAEIRRDTLRVLVTDHHLVHQRVGVVETGLEYELIERFARKQQLHLKAVPVQWPDSLVPWLERGVGDIVAVGLNGRSPIARRMATTLPYRFVSPVLVTLRPDPACPHRIVEMADVDSAWVSMWSPFAPPYRRFPGDTAIVPDERILFTDTSAYGDAPVVNVALGRVRAALASDAAAYYFAGRMPQLQVGEAMERSAPLVFGTRRGATVLLRLLDAHFSDPDEKEAVAMLVSAYSSPPISDIPASLPSCTLDLPAAMDPMTLAAILFRSGGGASAGKPTPDGADRGQVRAAARYLEELDSLWQATVPDARQRFGFVVASYLEGAGHVMDAQALATALGMDPQQWTCSVERTFTLLALPRYFAHRAVQHGPCPGGATLRRVREVLCTYASTPAALGMAP